MHRNCNVLITNRMAFRCRRFDSDFFVSASSKHSTDFLFIQSHFVRGPCIQNFFYSTRFARYLHDDSAICVFLIAWNSKLTPIQYETDMMARGYHAAVCRTHSVSFRQQNGVEWYSLWWMAAAATLVKNRTLFTLNDESIFASIALFHFVYSENATHVRTLNSHMNIATEDDEK